MKIDLTTGTWQDNPGCPINITLVSTSDVSIILDLEGNEVKRILRDFGSYMMFNKECLHKGYKSVTVDTYLSAQLFAAPASGQKGGNWQR